MTEDLKVTDTESKRSGERWTLNWAVRTDATLQSKNEISPNTCERRSRTYKGEPK